MAIGGGNPALQAAAMQVQRQLAAMRAQSQMATAQQGAPNAAVQQQQEAAANGQLQQQEQELAVAKIQAQQQALRAQQQSQYMRAAHALAKAHLGQGPQYFPRGYSSPVQRELYAGGLHVHPGGRREPFYGYSGGGGF